jgi:hypothetical protein
MLVIKLALHTSTHCERVHGAWGQSDMKLVSGILIVIAIIVLRRRSKKKVEDEF